MQDVVIGSIDDLSSKISTLDRRLQSYTHLVAESRASENLPEIKERRSYDTIGK